MGGFCVQQGWSVGRAVLVRGLRLCDHVSVSVALSVWLCGDHPVMAMGVLGSV